MSNIVTVNTANGPNSNFMLGIYNALMKTPPTGYQVLQHQSFDQLCDQLAQQGQLLQTCEIIADGNPYSLGVITVPGVPQLGQALQKAPPTAQIYFSGCNTGTWLADTNQFCISAYLAAVTICNVYGSLGYLNSGTYAQGTVQCSPTNWGLDQAYQGSKTANGALVFVKKPRVTMPPYAVPYPPHKPINVNNPNLTATQRTVLTNIVGPLASTPSQNVTINPRMACSFTFQVGADIYDFYNNGAVIRRELTGSSWNITLDANTQAVLDSITMPTVMSTAVVQQPAPAPKVQV